MAPSLELDIEIDLMHIDPSMWREIYVIGDIHGCIDEFEELLDELSADRSDLLLFVGDLIRKGPASERIVEMVRTTPNAFSVRGNNEQKTIEAPSEFGFDASTIDYFESLPLAISVGNDLVVHGGIDPRKALNELTPRDLIEIRSLTESNGYERPYWFERYIGPPRVVFGHTVFDAPLITDWAIGIDTGCVYGGSLSAIALSDGSLYSIPAHQTYARRDTGGIVTTSEFITQGHVEGL